MIAGFPSRVPLGSHRGFTLPEVLVSIFILTVGILGLVIGAITIMKANSMSHFHTVATQLGQDKLEQLTATTAAANISSCTGDSCEDPKPQYQHVSFTRTWAVTANTPAAGIKQIAVTVQWKDYTQHSLTFTSSVRQ